MLNLINDFLIFGKFERNFSINTIESYRNDLIHLNNWLNEKSIKLDTVNNRELSEFLIEMKLSGYEFSSVARTLFCLRVFFSWLLAQNYRKDNPAELLESPKLWTNLPELLSPEEISKLINSIKGKKHFVLRNKAIIEILYGCGMRISELVNIKMQNLNLNKQYIICYGKGAKERIIPFGKNVRKAITDWIEKGRILLLKDNSFEYLFLGQKQMKLTRQHVWLEIKKITRLAGIDKNIYPHIFRHSYATHLLAGGGDLRVVQELLGHADIATTQRYTQVDKTHILKQYSKFHPRA